MIHLKRCEAALLSMALSAEQVVYLQQRVGVTSLHGASDQSFISPTHGPRAFRLAVGHISLRHLRLLATDASRDMATFVLAGKADCPYFAKAELLADFLQRSLPDFRVRKICTAPADWEEWLEETCSRNQWRPQQSPLVWRELLGRGGKGVLLGGYSDFLEHCQIFYGVSSDMPSEIMLSIAAENLETSWQLKVEEQDRVALIQPLNVWISSALSLVCHLLVPHLLSAEVFPHTSTISLHLLDLEGEEEELQAMRREMEDLVLPLLHQVTVHTRLEEAFLHAHVILLLDERWTNGCDGEEEEGEEKKRMKRMKRMAAQYREYAQLIDARADREVKVIVAGDLFVNLRCSLLLENAPSICSSRFVAMATQLEYEAMAIIAEELLVRTSDVKDVLVWGNISGSFYIDLQRAKVFHYNGAIMGPHFFSHMVLQLLHDKQWLQTDFQELVRERRAAVASRARRTAAMSAANGILAVLRAWNGGGGADELLSVGVSSPGHFFLPDDLVCSVPVTFKDGQWSVASGVTVGTELRERLKLSAEELRQEKTLASEAPPLP
ncbi:putative malate dehydrogenase 1B [Genypterus blacodes]|uniref:putative malate dehydrogenase 1B n=1 Tax=Genypterus blacodes TaxID=154954 RepID=UPI003F7695F4